MPFKVLSLQIVQIDRSSVHSVVLGWPCVDGTLKSKNLPTNIFIIRSLSPRRWFSVASYRADILSPLRAGGHWWATQIAKHVSDQGNQHNNGPHQDQIFDNPSALCLVLWSKNRIQLGVGGGGGGLMHPLGSLRREYDLLSPFFKFPPPPPPPSQIQVTLFKVFQI